MIIAKPLNSADFAPLDEPDDASSAGIISQRLHEFFVEQGLPRHKHVSQLAVILELSRSGAFRKFQDDSFSATDLQSLAEHFQVDISLLLSSQPSEAARGEFGAKAAARIVIGDQLMDCKATVGTVLGPNEHCELVAIPQGSDWLVQPYAAHPSGGTRHRVHQLVITPVQRQLPRVAILEDYADLAANLKDAFEGAGFRVEVFASAAELSDRLLHASFDAYVIDWWLSGKTSVSVLQSIRSVQPSVPLILTTGAIANGHAVEGDIVRVAAAQRVHVIEKPFRLALLISEVKQLLSTAG